jgi:hypothetical protein
VFDGGWKFVLDNASLSNLSREEKDIISSLMSVSVELCEEFGIPSSHKEPVKNYY